MNPSHPTVLVDLGLGHTSRVPVDEDIAELVVLLNRARFDTSESCQDAEVPPHAVKKGPWVRIGMLDLFGLQALARFAAAVGINTSEWDFQVWAEVGELSSSALFPASDVPTLVSRLKAMLGQSI